MFKVTIISYTGKIIKEFKADKFQRWDEHNYSFTLSNGIEIVIDNLCCLIEEDK